MSSAAPVRRLASVTPLRVPAAASRPARGALEAVQRRWRGAYVVDEWGFDGELLDAASHLAPLRWDLSVGGGANVPPYGPALLVANQLALGSTALVVALAIRRSTGRAVRFTGIPDVAPVGPVLRRIGGVLARPDEVSGLLRSGHLVLVVGGRSWRHPDRAGAVPVTLVAPALELGVPVLPVAVMARPLARHARVEVGPPVAHRAVRGPLAETDLAEAARTGVQQLLDESDQPGWLLEG